MLGPIPYGEPEEGRLEREIIAGEGALAPTADPVLGRRWRTATAREGLLDFRDLFAGHPAEHAAALAVVHVLSPTPRWTTIAVGSDDGVSVRVNGVLFHQHDVPRGHRFGDDKVRVKLRRGWNRLLFKVVNGQGGFALSARFEEPEGLEFSTEAPVERWTGAPEPPELFIRTVAAAEPVWDFGGPRHRFCFEAANVGGQVVSVCLELRSGDDRTIDAWRDDALGSWASRKVEFRRPLRELVGKDGRLPCLALDDGSGAKPRPIEALDASAALDRLIGPYRVDQSGLDGGVFGVGHSSFMASWIELPVPSGFPELAAQAEVRHPGPASAVVNGRQVGPRFSGSSGWFPLGDPVNGRWTLGTEHPERTPSREPSFRVRFSLGTLGRAVTELRVAREFGGGIEGGFERLLAAAASGKREAIEAASARVSEEVAARVDPRVKKAALHLAGNAHIDLAWLWRIPETKKVCRDTFRSALDNMKRYPDFTFSHGAAQSYAWMEEEEPALFEEIRERVKEGRWEVVGGTWAESDTNMPTGESLVRQWLYGKRYFQEKFGVDVKVGWMPDTFGHPSTLPTIAKGCGLDAYVFFRPWEEARTFRWRGPDGSEVLGIRPPRWYMVEADGIDPALGREALKAGDKTGLDEQLVLVGVGDHGGGPTRDAIEKAALFDSLEAFPSVKFGRAHDFVERLREKGKVEDVHEGEVNFVFPGCWTSQGDHKRNNRRAEHELPAAETVAALASLHG
ncbi:MAG TPA: alpha-mannosidase, partial [Planctomycetota bacterium]|nr:alpha-mannosidase [Planctomycetota bacterium]